MHEVTCTINVSGCDWRRQKEPEATDWTHKNAKEASKKMTMMMKNSVILATCVVLLSSLIVQASESSFGPDQCCFKFYTRPLPKKKVEALQYTGKLCPMEGVLFKMRNGAVLCVDPSAAWVKPIIEAKEKQMAKKLSTPTPTRSS